MNDHRFNDPSADDEAEVISLLPPAVPVPASAPDGLEHADLVPLERYQQAANEHLGTSEGPRDRLEQELGVAKAEETAIFENLVAETTAQATATDDLAVASAEASSPHAAPREIGATLTYGLTGLGALGLWWVDHNILLSSFPTLTQVTVNGLAFVAVAGSMVSAHIAGAAAKDIDYAPPLDPAAKTNRRNKRLASVTGITIEVVLAVLRAVRTGAVLSSLLLGAAGVALWIFARSLAYRHRSKEQVQHAQTTRAERRARRRATSNRRRWVAVVNRHALAHRRLEERAHGVVDHLSHLAQETEVAWRRLNPTVAFPGVSEPGAAAVWHRYTQGWLPTELRLPERVAPSVDHLRYSVRHPSTPADPLELGPGSAR